MWKQRPRKTLLCTDGNGNWIPILISDSETVVFNPLFLKPSTGSQMNRLRQPQLDSCWKFNFFTYLLKRRHHFTEMIPTPCPAHKETLLFYYNKDDGVPMHSWKRLSLYLVWAGARQKLLPQPILLKDGDFFHFVLVPRSVILKVNRRPIWKIDYIFPF